MRVRLQHDVEECQGLGRDQALLLGEGQLLVHEVDPDGFAGLLVNVLDLRDAGEQGGTLGVRLRAPHLAELRARKVERKAVAREVHGGNRHFRLRAAATTKLVVPGGIRYQKGEWRGQQRPMD